MHFFDDEIEQYALKAYHEDPWTEEDYELFGIHNAEAMSSRQLSREIEMQVIKRDSDNNLYFEGGFEEK